MTTGLVPDSPLARRSQAAGQPPQGPVFLFSGVTVHPSDLIQQGLAAQPGITALGHEINDAAARLDRPPIFTNGPVPQLVDAHDHESLELAAYALSVAGYQALAPQVGPHRLLGHSFGQATALTCAQAFTVAEGARLILLRYQALRAVPSHPATGMACLGLPPARTHEMISRMAEPTLAVACHNAPDQTVVSGTAEALAEIKRLARRQHVLYAALPTTCALHTPWAEPMADFMRAAVAGFRQRPLRVPVYSATLSRYCADADDLVEEMLRDLTRPVLFAEAVRALHQAEDVRFVECGVKPMLTRMINKIVPGADIRHGTQSPR